MFNYLSILFKRFNFQIWTAIFVSLFYFLSIESKAQNCSVNANVDFSICGSDSLILIGAKGGLFENDSVTKWIQIGGPSIIIDYPYNVITSAHGFLPGNEYSFRLISVCADGMLIYDDVNVVVNNSTLANAGMDTMACPGVINLNANVPLAYEYGYWSINGINNGVLIDSVESPTSPIHLDNTKSGETILTWTITNLNGCVSSDQVSIVNKGGVFSISAGSNKTLSSCYNITASTTLIGSYAGTSIDGQFGEWSLVNGPSNPSIVSRYANITVVNNLLPGIYTFRWTVFGTCVSGISDVTITVPSANEYVSSAYISSGNQVFCDTSLHNAVFVGNSPQNSNETVNWTQATNLTATIENPTSTSTVIRDLDGVGPYTFRYQIVNSVTGCLTNHYRSITYTTPTSLAIISPQNIILPLDSNTAEVIYQFQGGNKTVYALISSPSGTVASPQYIVSNSPQIINDLNEAGQYIIRFKRISEGGIGNCLESFVDVVINTSFTPLSSNAGTDLVLGCNINSATLVGNQLSFEFGTWTQVSGPSTASITNEHSNISTIDSLINGVYIFRWSVNGGINSPEYFSDVSVTIASEFPTIASAGSDILGLCYNTNINLSGNNPQLNEIGTWSVNPSTNATISDIHNPNSIATILSDLVSYEFVWTIENACGISSDTLLVTTTSSQGIIANAGNNQCLPIGSQSAVLDGNLPPSSFGIWTQISGPSCSIENVNQQNSIVNNLIPGTYIFVWNLNLNDCATKTDTVIITLPSQNEYSFAGADRTICANSFSLDANNTINGIGTWSQLSGPTILTFQNIHNPNSIITNMHSGRYLLRWSISNGVCLGSSDSVSLTVSIPPSIANAGANQTLCAPDTIAYLHANTPQYGLGYWSFISGPSILTFSNFNSPTSSVKGFVMGTYVLKWNIQGGPNCAISSSDVIIYYTPAANAGTSYTMCNRSITTLTGNINSIGTWSLVSGPNVPIFTINGSNSVIVSDLLIGTYVFKYSINGGCNSSSLITVTNLSMPTLPEAGSNQELCNATMVQLNANNPSIGIGHWIHNGPGVGSFSPSIYNRNAVYSNLYTGSHEFSWVIDNGNCSASDRVLINNYGQPSISIAGNNVTACGLSTFLNANSPTVGMGSWSLVNGPGTVIFSNPSMPNAMVTCSYQGVYVFRWTIVHGNSICPENANYSDVTVQFSLSSPIQPNAGLDQSICDVDSLTLMGNDLSSGIGFWSFISGPNIPSYTDTLNKNCTLDGLIPGVYKYTWNSSFGFCSSADTVIVNVLQPPSASNAGTDISICIYSPLVLHANVPEFGVGHWSQFTGPNIVSIANPNSNTSAVNGLIVGEYVFEWTVSNGVCQPQKSRVKVNVLNNSSIAIGGFNQTLCNQSSTNLIGNIPTVGVGTWSFVSGPNHPTITNTGATSVNVDGLILGLYKFKWTVSNGLCSDSNIVQVLNNDVPNVVISSISSCESGLITLNSSITSNQNFILCDNNGNVLQTWVGNANSHTFSNLSDGIYRGKVTCNNCTSPLSSSTILLNTQFPIEPSSAFVNRNFLCPSDTGGIILSATGGTGNSLLWFKNDTLSPPIAVGNDVLIQSPDVTTTYYVAWQNDCGRSEYRLLTVMIYDIQSPVASINSISLNTQSGECSIDDFDIGNPIVSDNCGISSITNDYLNSLTVGDNNIQWIITDFSGNSNILYQNVHVNGYPKAIIDTITILENVPSVLSVLVNDLDCDNNLKVSSLSISNLPSNGSAVVNITNGTILYTPNLNFVGNDQFDYIICDSTNLCSTTTVYITVSHPNTPPDLRDSNFVIFENSTLIKCIQIDDPYGPFPFLINSVSCFKKGTVSSSINGSQVCLEYTPNTNFIGVDTICITICDQGGLCSTGFVFVQVVPNLNRPVIGVAQIADIPILQFDGSYLIHYQIFVENIGETSLNNIQILDSLSLTFPNPLSFYIFSNRTSTGSLYLNYSFNGKTDCNLLSNLSMLMPHQKDTIDFKVMVLPNGSFGQFDNSVYGFAYGLNGLYTEDWSDNGTVCDENNNGNPNELIENEPTPVFLFPYSQIGLANKVLSINKLNDESYKVDLSYKVRNVGNDTLKGIQIFNDLFQVLLNDEFEVTDKYIQSGSVVINSMFDGIICKNLLDSNQSFLNVHDSAEIFISINIHHSFGISKYYNSALVSAFGANLNYVSDISDEGTIVDLNSNGITYEIGENDPTLIEFGESQYWIPQGFSPNGDGVNDYFVIEGNEYYTISIKIFDRWGAIVYSKDDYQNDWDGTTNSIINIGNKEVTDGAYFYIIDFNNGGKSIQGTITINR